jgi:uncharacterized damage-inducible protein DinB
MKTYFINLFNYDRYANGLILGTILKANSPEKPVQLMAHLLAAQQIWYNRCNELPAIGGALWPDWKADTFEQLINDNHRKWIDFLSATDDLAFEKQVKYQNSKGDTFNNKLSDVLAHLVNHGTHHRAQAGQHLKLAGIDLPNTDYIFYIRTQKS